MTALPDSTSDIPDTGTLDLESRDALRRVQGLSTELQDITEVEYRQLRLEQVVLVGVWTQGTAQDAENSLRELAALAETAGSQVMDALIQRRDKPDAATFIGSGKARELRDVVPQLAVDGPHARAAMVFRRALQHEIARHAGVRRLRIGQARS